MKAKKEESFSIKSRRERKRDGLAMRIDKERRVKDGDFVVLDENCATHLVRNALGVGDEEVICGHVGAVPSFPGMLGTNSRFRLSSLMASEGRHSSRFHSLSHLA